MATTVIVTRTPAPNRTTGFDRVLDGEWFWDSCYGLGVKVDGRGFYPGSSIRGASGSGAQIVTKIKVVNISYTKG